MRMVGTFTKSFLVLVGALVLSANSSYAFDLNEGDLKAKPKLDDSKNKKLDAEVADSAMGTELDSDVVDADRVAGEQAKADELRLKEELTQLKQKKKEIDSEKDRVKAETNTAFQNLSEQNKRNVQARKDLEVAQKEKTAEDIKLNAAKGELQVAENDAKTLAEEQRKIQMHIQMAKDERDAAVKRMTELRQQATATKQRQAQQRKNIDTYRKKTQEFVDRETAKSRALAQARSR